MKVELEFDESVAGENAVETAAEIAQVVANRLSQIKTVHGKQLIRLKVENTAYKPATAKRDFEAIRQQPKAPSIDFYNGN